MIIHQDVDHNRSVITVVGEPEPLRDAVLAAVGMAIKLIDLRCHEGQHPRMGAVDVIPFIPIKNFTMAEAIDLSKEVAKAVWETYKLPVFLYEASASVAERANLANIRKGQFEGMAEKIKAPAWKPDFGDGGIHPTAGVVAIGARMPLLLLMSTSIRTTSRSPILLQGRYTTSTEACGTARPWVLP